MNQAFDYTEQDGVLSGPVRSPKNSASHLGAGSIHDDATAQKLGFRGGTVAGSGGTMWSGSEASASGGGSASRRRGPSGGLDRTTTGVGS